MYFFTTDPANINAYIIFHDFNLMRAFAVQVWDNNSEFYLGECFFNNFYTKNYLPFFQKGLCSKEKFLQLFHEDNNEFLYNFTSAIVMDTEFPHFENNEYAEVKKAMDREIRDCIKKLLEIKQKIGQ